MPSPRALDAAAVLSRWRLGGRFCSLTGRAAPTPRPQVTGPKSRKRIPAGQLRVAAAVRDASRPLARGAFLGASTSAGGLSPRLQLEACPDEAKRTVDAFSQAEVEAMLRHYADGGLAQVESEEELLDLATQLRVLSSGSGEAIRRNVIAPALGGRVGRVGRRQFV